MNEKLFVQKNADRLAVRRGRLFRLVPGSNKTNCCRGCAAYTPDAGRMGLLCSSLPGCIELVGYWKEITHTLPGELRRKYQGAK